MFVWGSTAHGQLGLGGIEDEQVCCVKQLMLCKTKKKNKNNKFITDFIAKRIKLVLFG